MRKGRSPQTRGAASAGGGSGLKVDGSKRNASILVIDLKSGWWSGDGGAFVHDSLKTIKALCNGARIDYHHLLSGDDMELGYEAAPIPFAEAGLKDAVVDIDAYGEIWLLSGSAGDGADYGVDEPAFVKLIDKIVASKANLYIGAGFGSVTHANVLGERLGLGLLFKPTQEQGNILSFDGRPEVLAKIAPKAHDLFTGVASLADVIRTDGREAASDDIVLASAKVLATDAAGQKVIATADLGTRKIVLDAGLQRLYAIVAEGTDTRSYLQNLVALLAK